MSPFVLTACGTAKPYPTDAVARPKYDLRGVVAQPGEDDTTPNGFRPAERHTQFAAAVELAVADDKPSRRMAADAVKLLVDARALEARLEVAFTNPSSGTASMVVAVGRNCGFPLLSALTYVDGVKFDAQAQPKERAARTYKAAIESETRTATLAGCENQHVYKRIGKVPARAKGRVVFVFKMPPFDAMRTVEDEDVIDLVVVTPSHPIDCVVPFSLTVVAPAGGRPLLPDSLVAEHDALDLCRQGVERTFWVGPELYSADAHVATVAFPHGTHASKAVRARFATAVDRLEDVNATLFALAVAPERAGGDAAAALTPPAIPSARKFDPAVASCRWRSHADLRCGTRRLQRLVVRAPDVWTGEAACKERVHYVFVGDWSGSMDMAYDGVTNRARAATEVATLMGQLSVDLLPKLARKGIVADDTPAVASLVGFHSRATVVAKAVDARDGGACAAAATKFASYTEWGMTAYTTWLEAARSVVAPADRVCVCLLTDGGAQDGHAFFPALADFRAAHAGGVEVVVVGFGAWLQEEKGRKTRACGYRLLETVGDGGAARAALGLVARATGCMLLKYDVAVSGGYELVSALGAVRFRPVETTDKFTTEERAEVRLGETLEVLVLGPPTAAPVVRVGGVEARAHGQSTRDATDVLAALDALHATADLTVVASRSTSDALIEALGCENTLATSRTDVVEVSDTLDGALRKPSFEAATPEDLARAMGDRPATPAWLKPPVSYSYGLSGRAGAQCGGVIYRSFGGGGGADSGDDDDHEAPVYRSLGDAGDEPPAATAPRPAAPALVKSQVPPTAYEWLKALDAPDFAADAARALNEIIQKLNSRKRAAAQSAIDKFMDDAMELEDESACPTLSKADMSTCVNALVHFAMQHALAVPVTLDTVDKILAFARAVEVGVARGAPVALS